MIKTIIALFVIVGVWFILVSNIEVITLILAWKGSIIYGLSFVFSKTTIAVISLYFTYVVVVNFLKKL